MAVPDIARPDVFTEPPVPTMYVQSARGMNFDGRRLVLVGLTPATIYLTGQPARNMGHLPTGMFLDRWYADAGSFPTRPVAAVLSFLDVRDRHQCDAQVDIALPRILDSGIVYEANVLGGDMPSSSGGCTLFIRPFLTPMALEDVVA